MTAHPGEHTRREEVYSADDLTIELVRRADQTVVRLVTLSRHVTTTYEEITPDGRRIYTVRLVLP